MSDDIFPDTDMGAKELDGVEVAKIEYGFILADNGRPVAGSAHNVLQLLRLHPAIAGRLSRNMMSHIVLADSPMPWEGCAEETRPLDEIEYVSCQAWCECQGVRASKALIADCIVRVAHDRAFNPVQDYLTSLEWDGTKRVARCLHDLFNCAPPLPPGETAKDRADRVLLDRYILAISLRWLVSCVARAMTPGCKVDTMLVLEGLTGFLKSTALRILCGNEWFSDSVTDFRGKDAIMQMHGPWLTEIAELDAMQKHDTSTIKAWLSRAVDLFRLPYARSITANLRSSVMVGTMNPHGSGYLHDQTGNRRFWPVVVHSRINVDLLRKNRDQVWAEAYHLWRLGEQWWLTEDEELPAAMQQDERTVAEPWEVKVIALADDLMGGRGWVTVLDILTHGYIEEGRPSPEVFGMHIERVDRRATSRVASVLRKNGFVSISRRRFKGDLIRPWRHPEWAGELIFSEGPGAVEW